VNSTGFQRGLINLLLHNVQLMNTAKYPTNNFSQRAGIAHLVQWLGYTGWTAKE